ncbi:YesL family protein [Streptococcus ictaluri]|uniref:DUF624 domain-containing protein n=1 Tax=Streptococcus ictaluri 707-05 TaxID=764299 RepID=G5K169_9STRE|nr:DUF624 domain-containing protein [Streptococcus ictaluri]EHI70356.1 hypothetical protein STRIC_0346 [Streptococcus ictaluri 707-05]
MTGIEKICFIIWKLIQLTLIFHLLSLAGLFVLGIGPAWQTIATLFLETSQDEKHYSLKRAFQIWKTCFKEANSLFYLFLLVSFLLGLNLHLALQMHSLIWFTLSFVIMVAMACNWMVYIYMIFYTISYEIKLWENAKLAFISVFLSFKQFLETLGVLILLSYITWQYKGLFIFISFGLLVFLLNLVTKPNRELVDGMIDEA